MRSRKRVLYARTYLKISFECKQDRIDRDAPPSLRNHWCDRFEYRKKCINSLIFNNAPQRSFKQGEITQTQTQEKTETQRIFNFQSEREKKGSKNNRKLNNDKKRKKQKKKNKDDQKKKENSQEPCSNLQTNVSDSEEIKKQSSFVLHSSCKEGTCTYLFSRDEEKPMSRVRESALQRRRYIEQQDTLESTSRRTLEIADTEFARTFSSIYCSTSTGKFTEKKSNIVSTKDELSEMSSNPYNKW